MAQQIKNPLKGNKVAIKTLTKMFNKDIANKLTSKSVYKYTATESDQQTIIKSHEVKEYETRHVNPDGTMNVIKHKVL